MILVDKDIRTFLQNGSLADRKGQTAIAGGSPDNITNIGYDLTASGFIVGGSLVEETELSPGQSVMVESEETIFFDTSTCGTVHIKNSRLRMGLSLESPLYQPGHKTRIYFRLTNLSDSIVVLSRGNKYAVLVFEQLTAPPDKPYSGTFQRESQYTNLAGYTSDYERETKIFEKKKIDLAHLEKSMYGNVITILSIFIAIFSIINVNFSLVQSGASLSRFFSFNLSIVGGIGFLAALMEEIIHRDNHPRHLLWCIPAASFAVVFLSAMIL